MPMHATLRNFFIAVLSPILICLATPPHPLTAQTQRRLLPSREYTVRLIAAPRAPQTGAKLVFNQRGPTEFGNTGEGEVAFGASLPLYLISGNSVENALVVSAQGGVFGRFTLTTITRDLISTDWIFTIPFTWHRGDNWSRLRYHHISSHIGDEYIHRFDVEVNDYSRDVVDFTSFHQVARSLGLYWGGNWAFNVHPDDAGRLLLRAGAQAQAPAEGRTCHPYGAVDVEWQQESDWEPRMNLQLGLRFPDLTASRTLRVAVELLAGPSPQGQFRARNVTHMTLGFYIEP